MPVLDSSDWGGKGLTDCASYNLTYLTDVTVKRTVSQMSAFCT